MNPRVFALAAALLALAAPARAQTTTLSDNNASVQITAGGVVTVFRANAGLDNVFRSEYFFRVGDAAPEQALGTGAAATTTLTGTNQRHTLYTASDGTYQAGVRYLLQGAGNAARLFETVGITNTTAAPLAFSLFSYSDYDLNFNPAINDDRAVLVGPAAVFQFDPTAALLTSADSAFSAYEIDYGIPPTGPIFPLRARLTDNAPTTLANTPGPGVAFPVAAPGDVAFAFQWNTTIAPGATFSVTTTRNLVTAIPEPGTLALIGLAAVPGLSLARHRRRRPL